MKKSLDAYRADIEYAQRELRSGVVKLMLPVGALIFLAGYSTGLLLLNGTNHILWPLNVLSIVLGSVFLVVALKTVGMKMQTYSMRVELAMMQEWKRRLESP